MMRNAILKMPKLSHVVCLIVLAFGLALAPANAAELWIGGATADITPDRPVALDGQMFLRISKSCETPITVTALALESREGNKILDQAVMVSCDILWIQKEVLDKVRAKVKTRLADFDPAKLFLNATHTHTAPVTVEGNYTLPESGIMRPSEYVEFMTTKVADVVVESWQKRQPGKIGWGQSQAVVAANRRVIYADGKAQMCWPAANTTNFRGIEGYEDHNIEVLFFWDRQDRLIATAVNVACPAQEVGGSSIIHADFWHPVRQQLRERHGKNLLVLGWIGAAGDQCPLPVYGGAADVRMRKLRGNLSRLDEIARRLVNAWEDAYNGARKDTHADALLRHCVKEIELPYRKITEVEAVAARENAGKFARNPAQRWEHRWNQDVVNRYERQQTGTAGVCKTELHVLRLGDVAIATNGFELFTDYGVQMKARSPAVQTFVIQLANPCACLPVGAGGSYLPTERAVHGGGYSAVIQSSHVGPEGGQVLADRTVEAIHSLWSNPK